MKRILVLLLAALTLSLCGCSLEPEVESEVVLADNGDLQVGENPYEDFLSLLRAMYSREFDSRFAPSFERGLLDTPYVVDSFFYDDASYYISHTFDQGYETTRYIDRFLVESNKFVGVERYTSVYNTPNSLLGPLTPTFSTGAELKPTDSIFELVTDLELDTEGITLWWSDFEPMLTEFMSVAMAYRISDAITYQREGPRVPYEVSEGGTVEAKISPDQSTTGSYVYPMYRHVSLVDTYLIPENIAYLGDYEYLSVFHATPYGEIIDWMLYQKQ